MILKNSLNFISEFFNYSSNQIRKIYLSSRIYNKKISRIDDKLIKNFIVFFGYLQLT